MTAPIGEVDERDADGAMARPGPTSAGDLFFTFNRLALQGFGGVLAVVSGALRGMGAVAAGLIIATAIKLMTTLGSNRLGPPLAAAFAVLTFVTIVGLRWPLIWVVAGLGTTAVAIAYARTP